MGAFFLYLFPNEVDFQYCSQRHSLCRVCFRTVVGTFRGTKWPSTTFRPTSRQGFCLLVLRGGALAGIERLPQTLPPPLLATDCSFLACTPVQYVTSTTGHEKIVYMGHSQGTVQAFAGLSTTARATPCSDVVITLLMPPPLVLCYLLN